MNPFSYGTIVRGPHFFDRKEELSRIVQTLEGGNNLVLYAPRRYGKSSLVMKAAEELERLGYCCIYFDFMPIYSRESFITAYSKAVLDIGWKGKNTLKRNWNKSLQTIADLIKGIRPSLSFDADGKPEVSLHVTETNISDETIDSVIDLPEKLTGSDKKTIMILDEFQDVRKLNGESFESIMRSRIQHHQRVNYLFLGSQTHVIKDMFSSQNRPFYHAASIMSIGELPKQETIEYLKNGFSDSGIDIDDEAAGQIIRKSGGIPYYIQFLASELWQQAVNSGNTDNPVDAESIEQCAENILDLKNDFYYELFDRQSMYQKKVLKALAHSGEQVFSADYARTHRLSAPSTTQKAITKLVNSGIIEKQGAEYTFTDPFFKWFVLRLEA